MHFIKLQTVFYIIGGLVTSASGLLIPNSSLGISLATTTKTRQSPLKQTDDDGFWTQQQDLMDSLIEKNDKSIRREQQEVFAKQRSALIYDTLFFTCLIFCLLWVACDNPFLSVSYVFGSLFGVLYAYGLGKFVETIGGSAMDAEVVKGAGVGQARFAFLILLVVFVGKLRAVGLVEIPSILGYFTYQIASLSQGLREIET